MPVGQRIGVAHVGKVRHTPHTSVGREPAEQVVVQKPLQIGLAVREQNRRPQPSRPLHVAAVQRLATMQRPARRALRPAGRGVRRIALQHLGDPLLVLRLLRIRPGRPHHQLCVPLLVAQHDRAARRRARSRAFPRAPRRSPPSAPRRPRRSPQRRAHATFYTFVKAAEAAPVILRPVMRKLLLLLFFVANVARAAQPMDAAQLQQALKNLTVVGSAMYVAAPPDDENTALIAFLGNERLYRTTYLSMTRGDGGQNLIGDEKGELLGVIRTQELLAARRIDGGEQAFTRAIDFGYSKNPQETLAIWGHDTILADVVWNIRRFQPDVIITRFPTTGEGGHGHHTASAILAVEAFKLAGDPSAFPDQLKYVAPWQPRRLFWNRFSFQPIKADDPSVAKSLRLDVGTYNATLGRAYTEIAAESRSQHKSQGFGSAERRGSLLNYFDQLGGDPAKSDIFEGIDTTWSRLPGGEAVGKILHQASDEYDPKNPSKSLPLLIQAYAELDRLKANDPKSPWPAVKQRDVAEAIRAAAGMSFDVAASDSSITPGGEITVNVSVVNRSDYPFTLDTVGSRYGDPSKGVGAPLKNNEPVKTELKIKVPPSMEISQPQRRRRSRGHREPRRGRVRVSGRAAEAGDRLAAQLRRRGTGQRAAARADGGERRADLRPRHVRSEGRG